MKTKVSIAIMIIVIALLGGAILLSAMYSGSTDDWMFRIIPSGVVPSTIQTTIGTITINAPLPPAPATVPIYHGYYGPGGNISFHTPNWSHVKNSVPNESEVPLLAQKALAPYGGIPPDAVVYWIGKSTSKGMNLTTGEVLAVYLKSTNIVYDRKINGMPVLGQIIRLDFGENGELLFLKRQWRTLTQIDQVPVISASEAVAKLQRGEVLNYYQVPVDVTITNISLGYYDGYPDREEETLEPVWIFSGPTSHGNGLSFYVDARVSGSSLQFANFTASPISGTAPLTVSFNDTSTGPIQIWQWDLGDGTSNWTQNPVHTYLNVGTYSVTVSVYNDERFNTLTKANYITVTAPALAPVANFTANVTTGKSPVTIAFTDTSSNTPASWFWDFGDNSTSTNQYPVHEYIRGGNYTVSLNATNENGSGVRINPDYIRVTPNPSFPNFSASPRSGKVPLTVFFNDTSSGGTPTLWFWQFGDGTNASVPDPVHTYTRAGNYTVDLETANGDGDFNRTVNNYITVLPLTPPVANFTATPLSGKAPLTVTFTDTSSNAPTSWNWSFGDGATSAIQSPVHIYSNTGNYTIVLDATNADGTGSLNRPGYISVSAAPPTTIPTTPPTTRPTPRPTRQPLSPLVAIAGLVITGLVFAAGKK
ncbi:MAG: PKD domain-containing protein [Methanoregula sp.]